MALGSRGEELAVRAVTPPVEFPPDVVKVFEAIGANVYRRRLARKLTQAQLAEQADLDLRFLQRVERGQTNLSVAVLVALARVLEVPLPTLFKAARLPPVRRGRPPARPPRR